jgi:proteasome activator subunit 4
MESIIEAAALAGIDIASYNLQDIGPSRHLDLMDDDDVASISNGESTEQSDLDKQQASLQTYLNSIPYDCESPEDMQEQLEEIVQKICICAKTKSWLVLTAWDGMLQWCVPSLYLRPPSAHPVCSWLLMRYPMAKSTRARLVRLYYELCLMPGIEPRVIRSWADMLSRLLANKPGLKRKLESTDLQLPWQPLWRVLHKELWPKKRILDSS